MKIKQFTFNAFAENTFVVSDDKGIAGIIDPGCGSASEQAQVKRYIEEEGLQLKHLINTHCHIDHILGNQWIADEYGLVLAACEKEVPVLEAMPAWGMQYGIHCDGPPPISIFLAEGETLQMGDLSFEILFVPGHSPGHLAFVNHQHKVIFGGDVLFKGGFGRIDLPSGDFFDLRDSILNKLFTLPDDYVVYAGHMETTTIGAEKLDNPIIKFNK